MTDPKQLLLMLIWKIIIESSVKGDSFMAERQNFEYIQRDLFADFNPMEIDMNDGLFAGMKGIEAFNTRNNWLFRGNGG